MPNTQLYTLEHIAFTTPDGFSLPGLWYSPERNDTQTVCVFLHGCGSSSVFYKVEKMHIFAQELSKQGIHFLAFNNRGAHYIKKLSQEKNGETQDIRLGTALEKIVDCVPDIQGAIEYIQKRGMKKIILLGESTGANKIVVYNHYVPDNPITAYVCVGGGDDMGLWAQQFGFENWKNILQTCMNKISAGVGDQLYSVDLNAGIMSYQSLFDVLNPDGDYNCFPYTEYFRKEKWSTQPLFRYWSEIKKPTFVLYGSDDIFTSETPAKAIKALQKHQNPSAHIEYQIVKNADHSFHGNESEEIGQTIRWWQSLED